MLIFLVYLGGLIASVSDAIPTITIVGGGVLFLLFLIIANSDDRSKTSILEDLHYWWGKFRCVVILICVANVGLIMMPTQKVYYAMLAVYAGQTVVESPEAKRIFDKALTAIEVKLDEISNNSKTGETK